MANETPPTETAADTATKNPEPGRCGQGHQCAPLATAMRATPTTSTEKLTSGSPAEEEI